MKSFIAIMLLLTFAACTGKRPDRSDKDSVAPVPATTAKVPSLQLYTDTLQYLHFEGNFDYWYGIFINAKKDTVQLVVNDPIAVKYRNKLVEVKWFIDTLSEAGDGETKYAGKRLKDIRMITGPLFAEPVTEATVIKDIEELPEVQGNAEQVGIAERPTDDKEYYLVETGTHGEDNFSRLFMFRVYVYPKYEIRYYDPATDSDLSLAEWRRKKQ